MDWRAWRLAGQYLGTGWNRRDQQGSACLADEFVRHKILRRHRRHGAGRHALIARFEGVRSGHGLNNRLLRALFADPANYEMSPFPEPGALCYKISSRVRPCRHAGKPLSGQRILEVCRPYAEFWPLFPPLRWRVWR